MKTESETAEYVRHVLADTNCTGMPICFRTDNGGEFTARAYVELCDSLGIRREYTAPDKPQQNAVVGSTIWRAMKGLRAARLESQRLFPGIDLQQLGLGPDVQ